MGIKVCQKNRVFTVSCEWNVVKRESYSYVTPFGIDTTRSVVSFCSFVCPLSTLLAKLSNGHTMFEITTF